MLRPYRGAPAENGHQLERTELDTHTCRVYGCEKYEGALRSSGPAGPEARPHRSPCLRPGCVLSLHALRADLARERREGQRPPRAAGNLPPRRPATTISAALGLGARHDGNPRAAVEVSDHRRRIGGRLAEVAVVR